jgi:uncharacterized membrane protein YhaH (DUF805 family)
METLRAFFSFYGRLNRKDYALVLLFGYLFPLAVFLYSVETQPHSTGASLFGPVLLVLMMWVLFAALSRRFRDIDRTGYACLLIFIPVVGVFTPFVLLFLSGTPGKNQYGPPHRFF